MLPEVHITCTAWSEQAFPSKGFSSIKYLKSQRGASKAMLEASCFNLKGINR